MQYTGQQEESHEVLGVPVFRLYPLIVVDQGERGERGVRPSVPEDQLATGGFEGREIGASRVEQLTRGPRIRCPRRKVVLRELTIEEAPPAAIESPEVPWSTAERAALKDALPELSSIHREVLVLRYWEGLSYREVAPITGCSVGTVGGATIGNVLALTMPLIAVTGVLSVLIATVSTVGVFLRLRTASLAEIQVRLAALEQMLLEGEVR